MSNRIGLLLLAMMLSSAVGLRAELRVGMAEATKAAVVKPRPEYSAIARKVRITGEVVVDAHVTESGDVEDVTVVSGNAMLTQSVVVTVKKWKFTPFTENGAPAKAVANLRFNFTLE